MFKLQHIYFYYSFFKIYKMQKILYTILLTLIFTLTLSAQNFSTKGTDFWTTFTPNEPTSNGALSVYISSDIDTKGNISIPFETFTQDFIVTAGTTLKMDLPQLEAVTDLADVVMKRGIHITAEDSVSVYILNYQQYTADATIVYPTSTLGKDYFVMGFNSLSGFAYPSQFVIVGTQNNTEVEITPSSATTTGQPANTPFSITLDQGQTYLLQSDTDLTGSRVRSNSPDNCLSFAVMAGAKCTNVGGCPYCDHLLEQMPPTTTWGTRFVTVPYKTRKDDLIRIMASEDGTTVTFDGGSPLNLDAGDFYETSWGAATYVEATKPIMIGQYSKGQGCDNVSADPFFIIISPIEQTLDYINFNAFASSVITNYYVNVVVPTDLVNKVKLDDFPQASKFSTLASQPDFSYAQIDILQGNHVLEGEKLIAYVYGYGSYESYGYVAGANLTNLKLKFDIVLGIDTSDYTIFDKNVCANEQVNFNVEYTDPSSVLFTSWDFGDNGATGVGQAISYAYKKPGTYNVAMIYQFLTACAPDTLWASVKVVSYSSDEFFDVCLGDKMTLTALSADAYLWSTGETTQSIEVSPTTDTYYSVELTGEDNCVSNMGFFITVLFPPEVKFTLSDNEICLGDTITANFSGNAPANATFNWNFDGATIVSGSGQGPYQLAWPTEGNKTINLEVLNPGNTCPSPPVQMDITVKAAPTATFVVSDDLICINTPITLTYTGNGNNTTHQYNWSFDGATVISGTGQGPYTLEWETAGTKNISLQAIEPAGCQTSFSLSLQVEDLSLSLTPADSSIQLGGSLALNATATGTNVNINAITWQWQPATDISCVDCPTPTVNPPQTTTYTLTATTPGGCTATAQAKITVGFPPPILIMPTAFSPNNDAVNDILLPHTKNLLETGYEMAVYNRWGQQVYIGNNATQGWNGSIAADNVNSNSTQIAQVGVYVWYVKAKALDGSPVEYKGNVTLVR